MYPVLFKIGGFAISTYGIMNMLGYSLAIAYVIHYRKRINIDKDTLWNILFVVILGAIAGGKIFYLIFEVDWAEFGPSLSDKLAGMFAGFRYGFVYLGGFITTVCALAVYFKMKKLPLLRTGDFIIVALPLGHAVGRIGCFLAGCCYGKLAALPWAVHFTNPDSLVPPHLHGAGLHPTQLYEAAANLVIFGVLHFAYNRKHKEGAIIALYAVCYGVMRFVMEFFRGDFRGEYIMGMSPSQLTSIVIITAALGFYFYKGNNENAK